VTFNKCLYEKPIHFQLNRYDKSYKTRKHISVLFGHLLVWLNQNVVKLEIYLLRFHSRHVARYGERQRQENNSFLGVCCVFQWWSIVANCFSNNDRNEIWRPKYALFYLVDLKHYAEHLTFWSSCQALYPACNPGLYRNVSGSCWVANIGKSSSSSDGDITMYDDTIEFVNLAWPYLHSAVSFCTRNMK